jgi:hypothetical protein
VTRLVCGWVLLVSFGAAAQVAGDASPSLRRSQGWSFLSGETVGQGGNVLEAQAGYPGASFAFLHGMSEHLDLGVALSLNYGFEGSVLDLIPGIKPQGLIRVGLFDTGSYNLGLRFSPGPMIYFIPQSGVCLNDSCFNSAYSLVGFTLPAELDFGIPAAAAIMLNVSLSIPFFFLFGPGGGAVVPILFGAGAEYYISRQLAVSFNTRMGPTLWVNNYAYFTFEALFGVSYRL